MSEHYTDPNEYKEYMEWKKAQEAPTPKAGDFVAMPRNDGTIDEVETVSGVKMGWQIKYIYPGEDGVMNAAVVNESKGLKKAIPLSELVKYNP